MVNLIIDSSYGMNIYLVDYGEVFLSEDFSQKKHSDEILKNIDELLVRADKKINDVDNICVCVGPGSFTGIRVAISVAKGLSIGTNAKLFILSNFDIFEVEAKNYFLVLEGFSNFVYVRECFEGKVNDYCAELEEFAEVVKNKDVCVYCTTEKTQNMLEKYEIKSIFAKNQIISAFNDKILKNESVELKQIIPVYLRASQAEIEREKKK